VEEAFVSALLCDVGTPALLQLVSDLEREVDRCFDDDTIACSVERLHSSVGAEIARRWSMPEPVAAAIASHHEPLSADGKRTESTAVATIQLARVLADAAVAGEEPALPPDALAILNLYPDDLATLAGRREHVLAAIEAAS
jgi:HD-like signal output (HDOD) protein